MSTAPPDVATLALADAAALPPPDMLRDLLDRLGLLSADHGRQEDGISLSFAGTGMWVRFPAGDIDPGSPAMTNAVGEVSTAAADPACSLTLSLRPHSQPRQERTVAVQHLFVAAAMVANLIGAQRLYWAPARLWSPVAALADAIAASEEQGLPPIMHLVAFLPETDADVVTRGLAYFCDIELRLTGAAHLSFAERVRRLARLAVHAMLVGPLLPGASVPGLVHGEILTFGRANRVGEVARIDVRLVRER